MTTTQDWIFSVEQGTTVLSNAEWAAHIHAAGQED